MCFRKPGCGQILHPGTPCSQRTCVFPKSRFITRESLNKTYPNTTHARVQFIQILKLLCVRFEIFNEIRQHFRIYGNTNRIKMNADHRNYVCGFFYSLRNGDNLQYFKFIIHMFLHRKFIPFQTRLISYKWQIPKTSVYFLFQSNKGLFLSVEFTLRVYLA